MRQLKNNYLLGPELLRSGIDINSIRYAAQHTYTVLDSLDSTLISAGNSRISGLIELANLSSMIGNLFAAGIQLGSKNAFIRNSPHTYPDLLANTPDCSNIEIKVALEKNKPKGHLAKAGYYLTCRYILGDLDGSYDIGKANRKDVVWFWEMRHGYLAESDFNFSSTEGDSGKTAVINSSGMEKLSVIYCDLELLPFSSKRMKDTYSLLHQK